MTELFSGAWPQRTGRVVAGLALAWILAGCGGGGGGGGGGSSSGGGGGGTTTPTPTVLGSALLYPGNAQTTLPTPSASGTTTAQITVAANAVPTADTQGVNVILQTDPSPPSTGSDVLESQAYDLEPSGQSFQGDGVEITIPYTPSSTAIGSEIFYYNAAEGQWLQVPAANNGSQIVNSANNTITVQVNNFAAGRGTNGAGPTDYAVLGIAPPGPP